MFVLLSLVCPRSLAHTAFFTWGGVICAYKAAVTIFCGFYGDKIFFKSLQRRKAEGYFDLPGYKFSPWPLAILFIRVPVICGQVLLILYEGPIPDDGAVFPALALLLCSAFFSLAFYRLAANLYWKKQLRNTQPVIRR